MMVGKKKTKTKEEIEEEFREVEQALDFKIEDIEGIGPIKLKKLNEHGIYKAQDLIVKGARELAEIMDMNTDQTAKMLGVYMGETFKGGALIQQYWDFAGDSDRGDVNMTNIQYLYYWSISDTMSIGAGPNILINWEQNSDNRYTVPVGFGINKTFQFGKVPVRMGIEYYQTVIEPDEVVASDWSVRFYIIPAAPSALFSWMQ